MKRIIALLMSVIVGISCLSVARATEPIVNLYVGSVNGIERKLYNQGKATYLKIGTKEEKIGPTSNVVGLDQYGVVWRVVNDGQDTLMWRSPEIMGEKQGFLGYDSQFHEFKYEGSGTKKILVGYKTHTGEEYPLPTFQEMCFMMGVEEGSIPEPKYIPSESPDSTPTLTHKISIIREKTRTSLYEGSELISKTTLKKNILTWERKGKKTKKYTNVKEAAFIEKSKNLTIVYKTGAVDVRTFKNATKKRILNKGGKKILYFEDYAFAIKTKNGEVNIRNK